MPSPRSARLIAAILTVTSFLVVIAPLGASALAPGVDDVENLRKQATNARNELDRLDKELKDQYKKLVAARKKLQDTIGELALANAQYEKLREPLAELASNAYRTPTSSSLFALFAAGDTTRALRSAGDVAFLGNSREALLKTATDLRGRRERLTDEAQDLQSRNALDAARLKKQSKAVLTRMNQLTTQLNQMLKRLDLDRDTKLTLQCDGALSAEARKYPNGLIPAKYLCRIPQKNFSLRADAALAFLKMNTAYRRHFGRDICLRDAYRNLADQQRLYYSRPGYAAVPGRSNHGLGQAADFCGGVESQGSPQFAWLRANATRYGWFHPAWAYSSPFEPWHWEFGTPE